MKVKNLQNNPIWIRNVKIMPGEVAEIDDKYEAELNGLKVAIVTREEIPQKIRVVPKDNDFKKLLSLKGVEDELAKELLDRFGDIDGIKSAKLEELVAIPGIGEKRAKLIKEQLEK